MKFCPYCGSGIQSNYSYCSNCGANIMKLSGGTENASTHSERKNSSLKNNFVLWRGIKLLVIMGACLLIVCGIISAVKSLNNTNAPDVFLGIELGNKVAPGLKPFDTNQSYIGYKGALEEPFLGYDQLFFHATLKTKTISNVAAGKVFNSYDEAAHLAEKTRTWVKEEYGIDSEYRKNNSPQNSQVWVARFDSTVADIRYFSIEIIRLSEYSWLAMIVYYDTKLTALEEEESRQVDYRTVNATGLMRTSNEDLDNVARGEIDYEALITRGVSQAESVSCAKSKQEADFNGGAGSEREYGAVSKKDDAKSESPSDSLPDIYEENAKLEMLNMLGEEALLRIANAEESYDSVMKNFFNLFSVGVMKPHGTAIVDGFEYELLNKQNKKTFRTLGIDKAAGIDMQFKCPIDMTCNIGNNPHVVYTAVRDFQDKKLMLSFCLSVWPYDEHALNVIRALDPQVQREVDFVKMVKDEFATKGQLVGCGITKISGQNTVWYTIAYKVERLGVKISSIARNFVVPASSGHAVVCSFSVSKAGEEYPVNDFSNYIKVGLGIVNSLVFMDKTQIKRPNAFDADMSGTGWFITQEELITCWHVIKGKRDISFYRGDGISGKLVLVGKDEFSDLAVLKVKQGSPKCKHPLQLSNGKIAVADKVFTVGYPLPDYMGKAPKYAEGVVSATTGPSDDERFIQISVPVQYGNSGGALLNSECRVVGVIQSKLDPSNNFKEEIGTVQNVNYAVKGYLALKLLQKLGVKMPSEANGAAKDNFKRASEATVFILAK